MCLKRSNIKIDGTPCEGKLSCTVWTGGKAGDDIKGLPIGIRCKISGYQASNTSIAVENPSSYGRLLMPPVFSAIIRLLCR